MMKPYVLITGASNGLGKAMACEYAKRNHNLVLVALPDTGLEQLAIFLESHYGIQAYAFSMDLSVNSNYQELYRLVKAQNITISYLVNNAGVLSQGLFEGLSEDYIKTQIEVNVMAPTFLSKLFLEDLKSMSPSGIINICSIASFFHLPSKQVYGATKSYLYSLSKSLAIELKPYKIKVSSVCPGGLNTTTRLCVQNQRLPWVSRQSVMDPEKAAKIILDNFNEGKELIVPGFFNRFYKFLNNIIPEYLKTRITTRTMMQLKPFSG